MEKEMNSLLDSVYKGSPSHLMKTGMCVFTAAVCAAFNAFSEDPSAAAREWDEKWDRKNILFSGEMRRDRSESFLQVPEGVEVEDFSVAATVPEVDFAIVQGLEPFYLPAPHPLETEDGRRDTGNWGGWGPVTRGPDGAFYFSIGNHRAYQSDVYIIQYDPAARSQTALLSIRDIIGWEPDQYGASKQHGFIDISPDGEMWLLTMNSPAPNERELEEDYRGCWLVRYNKEEGEGENMGVPLEGDTWPYHAWDWERDLLFAVGNKYVMAYDTAEQRLLYGGAPPCGVRWFHRVTMIDRESGKVYGTEMHRECHSDYRREESTEEHRFIRYQRRNNEFTVMDAAVPPNPVTGRIGPVRAHTREKDSDGAFWCFDYYGTLFRFYPEEDRVSEALGASWGDEGKYTTDMAMSPDERYLYFTPVGAGNIGLPVIQYDTETGEKKVLAFLGQFYREKYNYAVNRIYGMEIDEKGESLFFFTDGHFAPPKDEADDYSRPRLTRRPAIFHFFIPEEERGRQDPNTDSEEMNRPGKDAQIRE
jgi:hypothetical protein